jgi:hypothetical protein
VEFKRRIVMNRLINCTKVKSSKNFENNILKHFPKNTGDIYLDVVGMFRNGLRGSYMNKVTLIVNGEFLDLKSYHNDSQGWDDYTDWEVGDRKYQNWAKSTVLYLLAENKEEITEFCTKYPFEEGDDYWTIERGQVVWSCWDDISEELFRENPYQEYFETEEEAKNSLN